MIKSFSIPVPNELYVDDFSEGKVLELTYDGPDKILILVDKQGGFVSGIINQPTDSYNPIFNDVVEVDATIDTAVAYYYAADRRRPEVIPHITITNIDGSTHEEIAEPDIFDIYGGFVYNKEENKWVAQQILREKRSALYMSAETSKQYIIDNMAKFSSNTVLKEMAETYLDVVNDYQTTGNGSIYSWRLATWNIADVPQVPPPLVTAILRG